MVSTPKPSKPCRGDLCLWIWRSHLSNSTATCKAYLTGYRMDGSKNGQGSVASCDITHITQSRTQKTVECQKIPSSSRLKAQAPFIPFPTQRKCGGRLRKSVDLPHYHTFLWRYAKCQTTLHKHAQATKAYHISYNYTILHIPCHSTISRYRSASAS